ncbi:hypothetical protein F5144DRAFT_356876 [Chaetomium tenue]|uniref:Uncharacterized protein n=1 Tax=Chaetomium tenue TaxID=1854479 RepID=A0ACB7P070_9PEZI|nr:hypothetical protein F5144DRAFT_356876 [Chaetomium globosum]
MPEPGTTRATSGQVHSRIKHTTLSLLLLLCAGADMSGSQSHRWPIRKRVSMSRPGGSSCSLVIVRWQKPPPATIAGGVSPLDEPAQSQVRILLSASCRVFRSLVSTCRTLPMVACAQTGSH